MTGAKWKQEELEQHLASAVHTLTPEVWSRLDLDTPQQFYAIPLSRSKSVRRRRLFRTAAAACLCAAVLGSGLRAYVNQRVESVIGLDVNPSIELSVNRKERVLRANPLNEDAERILDEMNLKGVDLDIAVNALVGSMVRNGYLTNLDNAILVTVSNENREKAAVLRQDVVLDIEESLEAHQVQAVVYDQQASEKDEIRAMAERYGISYGKAYFLQELVEENDLSKEELKLFADMTMEEIAEEITARSYTVRGERDIQEVSEKEKEHTADSSEAYEQQTELSEETLKTEEAEAKRSAQESSLEEENAPSQEEAGVPEIITPDTSTQESVEAERSDAAESLTENGAVKGESLPQEDGLAESGEEESAGKKVRIDYVDYEAGILDIVFEEKVKWKNPTVSVQDDSGQSYSARITDTSSDSCAIAVRGLPEGAECSFTLAGVALKGAKSDENIRGYFETPEIAEEAEPNYPDWETEKEPAEEELPEDSQKETEEEESGSEKPVEEKTELSEQ